MTSQFPSRIASLITLDHQGGADGTAASGRGALGTTEPLGWPQRAYGPVKLDSFILSCT